MQPESVFPLFSVGGAWLLTYAIHSTLILGLVAVWQSRRRVRHEIADRLWKWAAPIALATSVLSSAGAVPAAFEVSLARPGERQVVEETRTIQRAVDGERVIVQRNTSSVANPNDALATAAGLGFAVWLVVASALLTARAVRSHRFHRTLRDVVPVGPGPALAALPVGRAIRIAASPRIKVPIALGRRTIILPERILRELSEDEQRAIIAHELAHLIRRDPLWLAFLDSLRHAFFFQPLHRLATTGFRHNAEILADDWAAAATGQPLDLARSITRVASWSVRNPAHLAAPALFHTATSIGHRVERLLGARPAGRRGGIALTLLALAAVTTAMVAPAFRASATPAEPDMIDVRRQILLIQTGAPREAPPSSGAPPAAP